MVLKEKLSNITSCCGLVLLLKFVVKHIMAGGQRQLFGIDQRFILSFLLFRYFIMVFFFVFVFVVFDEIIVYPFSYLSFLCLTFSFLLKQQCICIDVVVSPLDKPWLL